MVRRVEVHGTRARYTTGCRCDDCKEAASAYRKFVKERGPLPSTEHGTLHAYGNLGCRCRKCRDANSKAARSYELKRKGADDEGWIVK